MNVVKTEIPNWVMIPTSEMGKECMIGCLVEAWRNTIKVRWAGKGDVTHIGIYTLNKHIVLEPTNEDWLNYASLHN